MPAMQLLRPWVGRGGGGFLPCSSPLCHPISEAQKMLWISFDLDIFSSFLLFLTEKCDIPSLPCNHGQVTSPLLWLSFLICENLSGLYILGCLRGLMYKCGWNQACACDLPRSLIANSRDKWECLNVSQHWSGLPGTVREGVSTLKEESLLPRIEYYLETYRPGLHQVLNRNHPQWMWWHVLKFQHLRNWGR